MMAGQFLQLRNGAGMILAEPDRHEDEAGIGSEIIRKPCLFNTLAGCSQAPGKAPEP
jgi:hypothetical protein